tara:strand:+ start:3119 stop:3298 length:180 start_codon:yes stop_codon:yes gene_type:complete
LSSIIKIITVNVYDRAANAKPAAKAAGLNNHWNMYLVEANYPFVPYRGALRWALVADSA